MTDRQENLDQTPEEVLGTEFWSQPEDVLVDPTYNLIYSQVMSVLRTEHTQRGGSVIDLLLIERMAFMYAYLRMREANIEGAMTDRTRREMNKDWLDLATAMKKLWNTEDNSDAEVKILQKVDKAINSALTDFAEPEARKIKESLYESFEAHKL